MQIPPQAKYNAKFVVVVIFHPQLCNVDPAIPRPAGVVDVESAPASRRPQKPAQKPADNLLHPAAVTRLPVHQPAHESASPPPIPRVPRRISRVDDGAVKLLPVLQRRVRVPAARPVRRLDAIVVLGEECVNAGLGRPERVEGEPAEGLEGPVLRGPAEFPIVHRR